MHVYKFRQNGVALKLMFFFLFFPTSPSTLPNIETPYPMLVLVGPQGSGKKDLAMKLVDEFGDYFGYGSVKALLFICLCQSNHISSLL